MMEKERLLLIGLEENEVTSIKENVDYMVTSYYMLPKIKLVDGILYVESPSVTEKYLKVDKVIFHSIFENDFDFITLLALWNGPCLPDATGMMDLRLRHSGLVRSLRATRFGNLLRGMSLSQDIVTTPNETVAKWGNWHCGENKHKFTGNWETPGELTLLEPFIKGDAVRIMLVGEKGWQIKLTGDDWLKSIHHSDSGEMEIDPELLEDTKNIAKHFNLETVGVDYMVAETGEKYLLEVNHIPNITVFPFINSAFIEFASQWCKESK
jgi:hypothetical protein